MKNCKNLKCREPYLLSDNDDAYWWEPLGFCPSCRMAIRMGMSAGAGLVGLVTLVGTGVISFLRWLF